MAKKETENKAAVKKASKPTKKAAVTTSSLPMNDETTNVQSKKKAEKKTEKEAVRKAADTVQSVSETKKPARSKKAAQTVKKTTKADKKTESKPPKETVADKTERKAKKVEAVKEKKTVKAAKAVKAAKQPTTKKPAQATASRQEKLAAYEALSLEECITLMQRMNVAYQYEDYYRLLMDEADMKKLAQAISEGNHIGEAKFSYEVDGYDEDLIAVTLQKVAATMDVKAADFKDLKQAVAKAVKFQFGEDNEQNAAAYLDEFKLAEKLLMIAQRKQIADTKTESELIGIDVAKFFAHFFAFAYDILPDWQYSDVKFYEDFAYAVLSQFNDLYEREQMRIQIDVADLYIKHGDYQHGDEMYGYILRDNQIKDYIYYRFAAVYNDIDHNKAKAIAYGALQYVDERYTYHANIMEIIHS